VHLLWIHTWVRSVHADLAWSATWKNATIRANLLLRLAKMQLSHFLRRLAAGTHFCHGQQTLRLYARSAHGRSSVWIVSEVCILFDMHACGLRLFEIASIASDAARTILQAGAHA